MTMLNVFEVLAQSDKSWEDAARRAVTKTAESVHGIRSIYTKETEATVENDGIPQFRTNAKLSFTLA